MNELLLFFLKKGAHRNALHISTTEIGNALGMSQQNASRLLILLEQQEKIKRDGGAILLTARGLSEIKELYATITQALDGRMLEIKGEITEGLSEGGFYISLPGYKKQFKEKLGFEPFIGTLNLKLERQEIEKRHHLRELDPIIIKGWKDKKRSYGDLFAYKCKIGSLDCAVIIPVRTHHGMGVLELIAPVSIKDTLKKKNGDEIIVRIPDI